MVENGFTHVNLILIKHRNEMNVDFWGDLGLKLTSFDPNISNLAKKHQIYPSLGNWLTVRIMMLFVIYYILIHVKL